MTVSLVTGSSTGIGEATALALARGGHHTFATMRNPDAGSGLLGIAEAEGLQIELLPLDVTDPASCEQAVDAAQARAGTIDVLVNNAGIGGRGAVEELTDEDWSSVFATNVFGLARMTRLVLPRMREQGSGSIVNVSSGAGRAWHTPQAVYASSKAAVEAMSEALAQEVCRFGIKVAIIQPGVIMTPIFGKGLGTPELEVYDEARRRLGAVFAQWLPDAAPASEVADLILGAIDSDVSLGRYRVGPGTEEVIALRESMTDAQWADLGQKMTDAELNDAYRSLVGGRDIFPESSAVAGSG